MQNGINAMEEKIDKEKISNKINDLIKEINNLKKDYEKFINEDEVNNKKEYRTGEWVPKKGDLYRYIAASGAIFREMWSGTSIDLYRLSQGNVYPTEAIAEAAKKHAEFWRAFDMADAGGGEYEIYASDSSSEKIGITFTTWGYGCPKFKSGESARAWVESHGGEAYVYEMLIKGRVFKFTI